MKSLNQNVLGVINAAISSCDLISNSSFSEDIRLCAHELVIFLSQLTLSEIDQVQIEIPSVSDQSSL